MWIKILKGIYAVAVATGWDHKIKDWVAKKAKEAADKVVKKGNTKLDEVEEFLGKVEPNADVKED